MGQSGGGTDVIKLKRVYEPAGAADGERLLVERLWPRGVTKSAARLTAWLKDLAPGPALREWYGHEPTRWPEFRRRYEAELRAPEKRGLLAELAGKARKGPVTFVFAASDTERNSAVVLKAVVERVMQRGGAKRKVIRGGSEDGGVH